MTGDASEPAASPTTAALADAFRVEVPMPVWPTGRDRGRPVGWISANDRVHNMVRHRATQAWGTAAYHAFMGAKLPTGLPRIHVAWQYRFADARKRDGGENLGLTIKPILDALTPQTVKHVKDRHGRLKMEVHLGVGVVADDDPAHLVRGQELEFGPPLGRSHPARGIVVVYITPLPPGEGLGAS